MREKHRVNLRSALLSAGLGAAVLLGFRAQTSAQPASILRLAPFHSVAVPRGGHVVLRRASAQGVTLPKGSEDYTQVRVTDGGVLVIDVDRHRRPRDDRSEVEVQMPAVTRLSLSNGGWIRTVGGFPRQDEIDVEVSNGGTIDTRAMSIDRVNASVDQGGRIMTVPGVSLSATVSHGGAIVYWGNPRVMRSIEDGGVVTRGSADELNASLLNDDQFFGHRGTSISH